jgi:formylglycine-generating enzyme
MKRSKKYQKLPVFAVLAVVVAILFLSYSSITSRAYLVAPGMSYVPGGKLHTEDPETSKPIDVVLKPFLLDKNVVTVADFDAFVKATAYVTEAEKFGNAGVFDKASAGWLLVDGANFHFPFGRDKEAAKPDHPVTQISWNDATAYAKWKGKRLPTQWEWEFAARNGESNGTAYSWGDQLVQQGKYKANTWQGSFPYHNTVEDGYEYTSPAGIFGQNKLGLTDMGGNVWQWCTDDIRPTATEAASDPSMRKVLRGGSFLCDPLVCHGFKVTGRSSCTAETALVHLGFRCAKDI